MTKIDKYAKTKVHIYSYSVPCLEKLSDHSGVADFQLSAYYIELLGIDGERTEFEWNIFPGLASLQILERIQNDLQEQNIELEEVGDRIIFKSMFNDIQWTREGYEENCI